MADFSPREHLFGHRKRSAIYMYVLRFASSMNRLFIARACRLQGITISILIVDGAVALSTSIMEMESPSRLVCSVERKLSPGGGTLPDQPVNVRTTRAGIFI